tara:strand:- start:933 stop:2807 length:1875 start_codon:yes stop_codon:yes gene_type:complete
MSIPYNYIQTLKQLPRHGVSDENIKKKELDNINAKAEALDSVKLSTNELIPGISELDDITDKFNTTVVKSNLTFAGQVNQLRKNSAAIINLTKSFTAFEQRNVGIQKTFKLNTKEAATLGREIDKIAVRFNRSGATVRKYTSDLNKLLPGFQDTITSGGKAGDSLLKIQDAFQQQLGLSGDLANSFALFSGGNEEVLTSQLQIVKGIEAQTDGLINARDIVGDISGLSANLQLQFGKIPGNLELAVLKARTLGVSFADIAKTGNELLNVESSINNELEYQLLSGKRLVDQNGKSLTQQFRTAAIQGDANAQADALTKIIETQGSTIENNVFARQQLAKTLGMEEGQLAKIVQQRKLVSKLGAESLLGLQGADLQEGIEKFKKGFKGDINDLDDLLSSFDNRSTDEMLVQVLGKLEAKLGAETDPTAVANLQKTILADARKETIKAVKDDDGNVTTQGQDAGVLRAFAQTGLPLIKEVTKTIGVQSAIFSEFGPLVAELQKVVPLLGDVAAKLTTYISDLSKRFVFTGDQADPAVTPVNPKDDAIIRLNDAVLFNPNDKFNIVASTSPGALDQATADISGRGQSNGPSAQEIGAAVAQALQGVNLYVSPNELAAEMAFNSYNINT